MVLPWSFNYFSHFVVSVFPSITRCVLPNSIGKDCKDLMAVASHSHNVILWWYIRRYLWHGMKVYYEITECIQGKYSRVFPQFLNNVLFIFPTNNINCAHANEPNLSRLVYIFQTNAECYLIGRSSAKLDRYTVPHDAVENHLRWKQ